MPYLKSYVSVSLDYPVYIKVPDDLDYESVLDAIEETSPCGWAFADDDVVSAVSKALPIASSVMTDVGATDDVFDSYPKGSLVYDLERISSPKAVRAFAAERKVARLKQELEDALYEDDFESVARISKQLLQLQ